MTGVLSRQDKQSGLFIDVKVLINPAVKRGLISYHVDLLIAFNIKV
jgi:hypothetical protein